MKLVSFERGRRATRGGEALVFLFRVKRQKVLIFTSGTLMNKDFPHRSLLSSRSPTYRHARASGKSVLDALREVQGSSRETGFRGF